MLRIALSSIDKLTLDNLRIALVGFILSQQQNKQLMIYLNDNNAVLDILNLFSIDCTRVIYKKDNIKYHTQMAMKLLLDKKAFNCFCSDEALEQDKQKAIAENKPYVYNGFCEHISDEAKFQCNAPFSVRIKQPERPIKIEDLIAKEYISKEFDVDSFVILNRDKIPTTDLAYSIDDMLYDISMVLELKQNLNNSYKQVHIRNCLDYTKQIKYTHISSISNKSDLPYVNDLIENGYLPAAIANYLIVLGYNNIDKEVFTLEECLQWFDVQNISQSNFQFDMSKLDDFNRKYIQSMDNMRLSKILGYADEDIGKLAKLYLDRCSTTEQLKQKINLIFAKKEPLKGFETQYVIVKDCLKTAPFIDNIDDLIKYITKQTNLTIDEILVSLRYILTGETNQIDISNIYSLIKNYLGEIL